MLERILEIVFEPITGRIDTLMTAIDQLNQKIETLKTSLSEAKARIDEDIAHLRSLLEDRVDPADLEPIITQLDQLTQTVQAIDPDTAFPPENPPQPAPPTEG
jgi:uncharacterized protein HemX